MWSCCARDTEAREALSRPFGAVKKMHSRQILSHSLVNSQLSLLILFDQRGVA
jgi:hypothetical protein